VPGVRYVRKMINGVPVVAAPAEIDTTAAEHLRAVLLDSAARGHTTIVVDMTGTVFCDSSGLHTLLRAHKRAVANGGELRLVVPLDGAVAGADPEQQLLSVPASWGIGALVAVRFDEAFDKLIDIARLG
jgi:anti-anti-sigma factor